MPVLLKYLHTIQLSVRLVSARDQCHPVLLIGLGVVTPCVKCSMTRPPQQQLSHRFTSLVRRVCWLIALKQQSDRQTQSNLITYIFHAANLAFFRHLITLSPKVNVRHIFLQSGVRPQNFCSRRNSEDDVDAGAAAAAAN